MDRFEGGHGHGGDGLFLLPAAVMMVLAVLLVAALTAAYLVRSGRLSMPAWGRPAPEDAAKRVLADRFAQGEMSSEEFLDRSSMLGWTPGSDSLPRPSRRRVR